MKIKDIEQYLLDDVKLIGKLNINFYNMKSKDEAKKGDITFILSSKVKDINDIINNPSSLLITDFIIPETTIISDKCIIITNSPRLQIAKLSLLFFKEIQSDLLLHEKGYFYHPTSFIGKNVLIGKDTKIYANVTIYNDVQIGENCIINSGTVIGAEGFGYEKDEHENWIKIAHLAKVVIGNNVDIGANTCIDRGTFDDTVIEDGVKIDNLVHIAHNVKICENSMIIALAMIAGSCVIGKNTWIAPCSVVRDRISIGEESIVGLGAVVVKDVKKNTIVAGFPAKPFLKKII